MPWSKKEMPALAGKVAVVTGANSGIGFEAALGLAEKGATVVLACRSAARGEEALRALRSQVPSASLEFEPLDLASLASIRGFADRFLAAHDRLDILCNNAGVMALPYLTTEDGFEMQFGTNHLGHFALTGRLFDALRGTPGARVVNVSSNAHKFGRMRFDDLQSRTSYRKWLAYGQSKLANLLFTLELQRRCERHGFDVLAAACHPGYSATNLPLVGPELSGSALMQRLTRIGNRLIAQSAAMGALPTLYAATAPDVAGGDYIGPDGPGEIWGHPKKTTMTRQARDPEAAARLWSESETLTNIRFAG